MATKSGIPFDEVGLLMLQAIGHETIDSQGVIKAVLDRSRQQVKMSVSAVRARLNMLAAEGVIVEVPFARPLGVLGRPRRFFELTEQGRSWLVENRGVTRAKWKGRRQAA